MSPLVDSYSSVKEQRSKMYKLILEKCVRNATIHHVAKPIKSVSQVPIEYSMIKYHNSFEDLFIARVAKFQTKVGDFVLELLNIMKNVLNRNVFFN